jgi:hypothetical protein
MAEQREEDRITDNYEDDLRKSQAKAHAAWLEAEGKRLHDEERRRVFDVAAGFVLAVVLIVLICVVLSGVLR